MFCWTTINDRDQQELRSKLPNSPRFLSNQNICNVHTVRKRFAKDTLLRLNRSVFMNMLVLHYAQDAFDLQTCNIFHGLCQVLCISVGHVVLYTYLDEDICKQHLYSVLGQAGCVRFLELDLVS